MFRIAGLFLPAMIASLCSGCLSTSVIYDPHMYQTGRTLGKGKNNVQASASYVLKFRSAEYKNSYRTTSADHAISIGAGLSYGLMDKLDVGGMLHYGFGDTEPNTIGLRVFLKQMITSNTSRTAISFMPACSFMSSPEGNDIRYRKYDSTTADQEQNDIASSRLGSIELHLPVSHRVNERFTMVIDPNVQHLFHWFRRSRQTGSLKWTKEVDLRNSWLCPGLVIGAKYGPVFPEAGILLVKNDVRYSVGIGYGK